MKTKKLLSLALCVSLLAGCGASTSSTASQASSSPESSASSSSASSDSINATNTIAYTDTDSVAPSTTLTDNKMIVGMSSTPNTLTPFHTNAFRDFPFFLQMYEALGVEDPNGEFQPWGAKSWTTDDNGKTYHFELWDNITDSAGNAITASDVVWFINEAKTRAMIPNYNKVESATVTGDYTFDVAFTANIVGVLETFLQDTYLVSQTAFEASSDEFAEKPICSSAYEVTEYTSSSSVTFTRRDDYWAKDMLDLIPECVRPLQKEVKYEAIPEASQMGIAVETNEIDVALDVATSTGRQYVNNDDYTVLLQNGPKGWTLFFSGVGQAQVDGGYVTQDQTSLVADNVKLRQALCYAIDQEGLVQGLSMGYAVPMYDVASETAVGFQDKWKTEDYLNYDLDKAKALVKESGYNGEELSLLCTNSTSMLAQLLQNYWLAAGINVKLDIRDAAGMLAIRLDGTQYDMFINTISCPQLSAHWQTRYDQNAFMTNGYACDATGRHDEALQALLDKTWTVNGYTDENIDEVHSYLRDNAIGYGLVDPMVFSIWKKDYKVNKILIAADGRYVNPAACQIG